MSYVRKKLKMIFIFLIIGVCFSSVYVKAKENEKLKLNYVKQIANQPIGYQSFTLAEAVNQTGKKEWVLTGKEIYFQKQQCSSGDYDVTKYKTKIKAKLAADFTLLQYQSTKRENGTLSNSVSISFKPDKNKYIINKNNKEAERKKERTIKANQPVYFYQPWMIEILVKNDLLPESKKVRFLRKDSSDKYQINSFYLKKLTLDKQGEKVFLVSKCEDKIFINERNGLAKMHRKENNVDIISGTINKDKVEPLEVTKFSHIPSNVRFINQERLLRLKLKVDLPFKVDKNKYLNSSRQNFVGTVDENGFKGKVTIKAEKHDSKQSISFPIEKRWAEKKRTVSGCYS